MQVTLYVLQLYPPTTTYKVVLIFYTSYIKQKGGVNMAYWGKEQQVCATCRYWAGMREMDFSASHFNAFDTKGLCNGPFGSFCGINMSEGASCTVWETFRN